MRLSSVRRGDIVECDVRGDIFLALVAHVGVGELEARPISNGRGRVRIVRARQVREHWRLAGKRDGAQRLA